MYVQVTILKTPVFSIVEPPLCSDNEILDLSFVFEVVKHCKLIYIFGITPILIIGNDSTIICCISDIMHEVDG